MTLLNQVQLIQTTGHSLTGLWRPSIVKMNQRLYVFGGGGNVPDDIHVLDLSTMCWEPVQNTKGTRPSKRYGHTLTAWNNYLVVFGGCNDQNEYCNDLHMFDLNTATWVQPDIESNTTIPARYLHSAVVFDDKLFVYAGFSQSATRYTYVLNEMNVLDLKAFVWSTYYKEIKPRYNHSATLIGDKIVEDQEAATISYIPKLLQTYNNSDLVLHKSLHFCDTMNNNKLIVFGCFLDIEEAKEESIIQSSSPKNGIRVLDLETLNWKRYHESLPNDSSKLNVGAWNYFTTIEHTTNLKQDKEKDNKNKELLFFLGNRDQYRPKGYDHYRDALLFDIETIEDKQDSLFLRAKY